MLSSTFGSQRERGLIADDDESDVLGPDDIGSPFIKGVEMSQGFSPSGSKTFSLRGRSYFTRNPDFQQRTPGSNKADHVMNTVTAGALTASCDRIYRAPKSSENPCWD
jgi:hypothetical protein